MTYTVSGTLDVDLRDAKDDHAITRMVQSVVSAPPGAHVHFRVRPGSWPPPAIQEVVQQGTHLGHITVMCDDRDTLRRWCQALRGVDVLALEWQKAG